MPSPDKPKVPVNEGQLEAIKNCVTETLTSYKIKRIRNKAGAIFVHLATILLSITTTIILGWQLVNVETNSSHDKLDLTNLALVLSALTTGISTLDSVFDYRALWVGYNIGVSKLKSVLSKLEYLKSIGAQNLEQEQIEDLYNRYDMICSSMEKDYKDIRTSNE